MVDQATHVSAPLATNFQLTLTPAAGYRVGRIYGAPRAVPRGGGVTIDLPALFVGRSANEPTGEIARGGGGGLFVELIADGSSPAGSEAFAVDASWTTLEGGTENDQQFVLNALAQGQNPEGMWPSLSQDGSVEIFMTLNMYLALRATVKFYEEGDCGRAAGLVDMFAPGAEVFLDEAYSEKVAEDLALLRLLRRNVETGCSRAPTTPQNFDGGCMMI